MVVLMTFCFLGCERLGEATYTVARLHRTDGGGCKCCFIHFWFLSARGNHVYISFCPFGAVYEFFVYLMLQFVVGRKLDGV